MCPDFGPVVCDVTCSLMIHCLDGKHLIKTEVID